MATVAAPGGGGARRPGKTHHSTRHHLSGQQDSTDLNAGWADGISSLTEGHSAAALLDREDPAGVRAVGAAGAAAAAASAAMMLMKMCRCPCCSLRVPALPQALPASAAARLTPSPATADAAAAAAAAAEGRALRPGEERRARLEHALSSLEVEVAQHGELVADLGGSEAGWGAWVRERGVRWLRDGWMGEYVRACAGIGLCPSHPPIRHPPTLQAPPRATAPPASPSRSWTSCWRR